MGLYLCVFDDDEEVDGVEVGSYADFGTFRDTIRDRLEGGRVGSRFPVLMIHSDCDGEWSPDAAISLEQELMTIEQELAALAPVAIEGEWQRGVAKAQGLRPESLRDCFFDVDGEPLIERLRGLCRVSATRRIPIRFQ